MYSNVSLENRLSSFIGAVDLKFAFLATVVGRTGFGRGFRSGIFRFSLIGDDFSVME
jgi:hypothetical protein